MQSTSHLVLRYLHDAWAAEKEHQKMLAGAIARVAESQVLSLLRDEFTAAHAQEEAIEACLRGRGEEPSSRKSILGWAMELLATPRHHEDEFDSATVALETEFGAASLKVGLYRTLEAYASLGSMPEVAQLASAHLEHEREALTRAWTLMPQVAAETLHQSYDTQAQDTASGDGMPQAPETAPSPWMARMDSLPVDGAPLTFTPPQPLADDHRAPADAMEDCLPCVRDVMTRAVGVIGPEATVQEAAAVMRELNVGPLPVCEGDRVIGMITDRDLALRVVALGQDPRTTTVRMAMTPEIYCAAEGDDLSVATQVMKELQVRRLPVVDEQRHIRGMLSLSDVAVRQGNDLLTADVLRRVSEPGPVMLVSVMQ